MSVWTAISRLVVGSDEEEKRVLETIRERKRKARYDAAEKLEQNAKRNIEDAVPGPAGDELRAQGRKMCLQAEWLRNGEISLLAAMNVSDGEDSVQEVLEKTVSGDIEADSETGSEATEGDV